jgi:hypothetical protein
MNGMGGAVISGIGFGGIQNTAPNSNGFNPSTGYTAEKQKQAQETTKNTNDLQNMMHSHQ